MNNRATKKIPGEGFKRPWPPLIKMDAAVKAKVEKLFKTVAVRNQMQCVATEAPIQKLTKRRCKR
jgi:hypothetical protein